MQVCSCRYCKAIFRSPIKRTVCDRCLHRDDELFQKIVSYLDQYPNSNAVQIAAGLEINVMEILRFIDEGRLTMVNGEFVALED